MRHLRSFVALSCTIGKSIPFSRFQYLRVLALDGCELLEEYLTVDLGKLLHLRYLSLISIIIPLLFDPIEDVSYIRHLSMLPRGIEKLKFLQTLDLRDTRIEELPSTISKLTQLVCLRGTFRGGAVGRVIQNLSSLQELEVVSEQDSTANELEFCRALGNLRELRVLNAHLNHHNNNNDGHGALLDSLSNMRKLHHLELVDYSSFSFNPELLSRWYTPGSVVLSEHIRTLLLSGLEFSILPKYINPSVLPKLSELLLNVYFIDHRDMRIIGKFQELYSLFVHTPSASWTMKLLVVYGCDDGYFRKLRSFKYGEYNNVLVMFKGCKFGAPVIQNLENLDFSFLVNHFRNFCVHHCQNISALLSMIGWNHLPSLKNVYCGMHDSRKPNPNDNVVKEEVKLALNHMGNSHPNLLNLIFRDYKITMLKPRLDTVSAFDLPVHVWMFRNTVVGFDFTNLVSLKKVTARIYCLYATPSEVLQVEAALRCAIDFHPNNITLEMERIGEDEMDELSSESEEQQLLDDDASTQEEQGISAAGQGELESLSKNITGLQLHS